MQNNKERKLKKKKFFYMFTNNRGHKNNLRKIRKYLRFYHNVILTKSLPVLGMCH